MEFLRSAGFSLACAVFNVAFAVSSFMNGSLALTAIGLVFAAFCFNNYLKAR